MMEGRQFFDSTIATRLNDFVADHGDPERREELLAELELPPVLSELCRRF